MQHYEIDQAIKALEEKYKTPHIRTFKVKEKEILENGLDRCWKEALLLRQHLQPLKSWVSQSQEATEVYLSIDTDSNPVVLLEKLNSFDIKGLGVKGNQMEMKL